MPTMLPIAVACCRYPKSMPRITDVNGNLDSLPLRFFMIWMNVRIRRKTMMIG